MDVFLSLINGVNGAKGKGEYDNGVVQVRRGLQLISSGVPAPLP